jgi:hypothetical protein
MDQHLGHAVQFPLGNVAIRIKVELTDNPTHKP